MSTATPSSPSPLGPKNIRRAAVARTQSSVTTRSAPVTSRTTSRSSVRGTPSSPSPLAPSHRSKETNITTPARSMSVVSSEGRSPLPKTHVTPLTAGPQKKIPAPKRASTLPVAKKTPLNELNKTAKKVEKAEPEFPWIDKILRENPVENIPIVDTVEAKIERRKDEWKKEFKDLLVSGTITVGYGEKGLVGQLKPGARANCVPGKCTFANLPAQKTTKSNQDDIEAVLSDLCFMTAISVLKHLEDHKEYLANYKCKNTEEQLNKVNTKIDKAGNNTKKTDKIINESCPPLEAEVNRLDRDIGICSSREIAVRTKCVKMGMLMQKQGRGLPVPYPKEVGVFEIVI